MTASCPAKLYTKIANGVDTAFVSLSWQICRNQGCTGAGATDPTGQLAQPRQAWLVPQPVSTSFGFSPHASMFGSTADRINKNSITATLIDDGGFNGVAGYTANDRDSTSNFISYHTGGGNFGMGAIRNCKRFFGLAS